MHSGEPSEKSISFIFISEAGGIFQFFMASTLELLDGNIKGNHDCDAAIS